MSSRFPQTLRRLVAQRNNNHKAADTLRVSEIYKGYIMCNVLCKIYGKSQIAITVRSSGSFSRCSTEAHAEVLQRLNAEILGHQRNVPRPHAEISCSLDKSHPTDRFQSTDIHNRRYA